MQEMIKKRTAAQDPTGGQVETSLGSLSEIELSPIIASNS